MGPEIDRVLEVGLLIEKFDKAKKDYSDILAWTIEGVNKSQSV